MTEGKRVALYARVSTTDQTAENQLLDLRRYCTARGWEIVEEFVDLGISGAKADRPALGRLMDAARKRLVDGVLVWRFDRFARSVSHLVAALQDFNNRGIRFTSYTEGIDTGTPQGKMVFTIIAAMAEFERDIITERIRAGVRRAKADGKHLGRPGLPQSTIDAILSPEQERRPSRAVAADLRISKTIVNKVRALRKQDGGVKALAVKGL